MRARTPGRSTGVGRWGHCLGTLQPGSLGTPELTVGTQESRPLRNTQAGVGVTAGGHLHEGEHPPHGGAARLCPVGHKQRRRHSTKVARCAAATHGSLRMQRQPGELPESAEGGGARAAAPAEARDEQPEEEEQQADWGPGAPGAACPKGKKLSSTCSQDTSRAEGPMTAATGPRG